MGRALKTRARAAVPSSQAHPFSFLHSTLSHSPPFFPVSSSPFPTILPLSPFLPHSSSLPQLPLLFGKNSPFTREFGSTSKTVLSQNWRFCLERQKITSHLQINRGNPWWLGCNAFLLIKLENFWIQAQSGVMGEERCLYTYHYTKQCLAACFQNSYFSEHQKEKKC